MKTCLLLVLTTGLLGHNSLARNIATFVLENNNGVMNGSLSVNMSTTGTPSRKNNSDDATPSSSSTEKVDHWNWRETSIPSNTTEKVESQ